MKKILVLLFLMLFSTNICHSEDLNKQTALIVQRRKEMMKVEFSDEFARLRLASSFSSRGDTFFEAKNYEKAANDYRSALFYLKYHPVEDKTTKTEINVAGFTEWHEEKLNKALSHMNYDFSSSSRFKTAEKLLSEKNYSAAGYEYYMAGFDSKYAKDAQQKFYSIARALYGTYFCEYAKFYDVDYSPLTIKLKKLKKEDIKKLNIEDKKTYKDCIKIDKITKKQIANAKKYNKPLNLNSKFLPKAVALFNYNSTLKSDLATKAALNNIITIHNSNLDRTIFPTIIIYDWMATFYYYDKQYANAIKYYEKVVPEMAKAEEDIYVQYVYCNLADCYYYTKNYTKAIEYAKKINDKNKDNYFKAQEILYFSYLDTKNTKLAHEHALYLYNNKYPNLYAATSRLINTISDVNKKIQYLNNIRYNASSLEDKYFVVYKLITLDKTRIDNASKTVKTFFVKPDWQDIATRDEKLMSVDVLVNRYFGFHDDITACIKNYSGNNLKACFESINAEQEKYTQRLIVDYQERNRQIAEQQRLQELQRMNAHLYYSNVLQSHQNFIQSQQNNLMREQNSQLNKPVYTQSTITRPGNYYNVNSVSY